MKRLLTQLSLILLLSYDTCLADWDISISGGYGQRSNPYINSENTTILTNIDIAWYGDTLFFDNGDIGKTLWSNNNTTVNLIGEINNERHFFAKASSQFITIGNVVADSGDETSDPVTGGDAHSPPLDNDTEMNVQTPTEDDSRDNPTQPVTITIEIPDRNFAYEAGIEVLRDLPIGSLYVSAVSDISNTHNGTRIKIQHQTNKILGRWHINARLGAQWNSDGLNDYYYGIKESEASSYLTHYQATSGINYSTVLSASYAITPKLYWGTHVGTLYLHKTIQDSPLIEDNRVNTLFTGLKYRF